MIIIYTGEPSNAVLRLNSTVVGVVDTDPVYAQFDRKGEQVPVLLDHVYPVDCVVTGGNPPPTVNLSTGVMPSIPFHGVQVSSAPSSSSSKIFRVAQTVETTAGTTVLGGREERGSQVWEMSENVIAAAECASFQSVPENW